jgi:thiamine biosynthesis lipoprotein
MHRRSFLDVQQLARTAGQVSGAVAEVTNSLAEAIAGVAPIPEMALVQVSRRAMATAFEIILPCGSRNAIAAAEDALDQVDQVESRLTVYRDDSAASQLNQRAAHGPFALDEDVYDLLKVAYLLSEDTDGAFDITAGALVKAWGFFRRAGRVPTMAERADALSKSGFRNVLLDDGDRSCRFLLEGIELNLGSIGKGYALDRAAVRLRQQWHLTSGLLHGGHSSVYALGSDPRDARGWSVSVQHPEERDRQLAVVRMRDAGLATSAATFQHLEYNGRKLGHVLDPRIGWPADKLLQATAIAPTSAEADALSTAFFVLGVEGTKKYCAAHPRVGAILLAAADQPPLVLNLPESSVTVSSVRFDS